MIIRAGKRGHRGPQHAHPSLLAPSHSAAGVGGVALLVGLGFGLVAALAGGPDGAAAGAAVPHALKTPQVRSVVGSVSTTAQLQSSGVSLPVPASSVSLPSATSGTASASAVAQRPDNTPVSALAASGIPVTALKAYEEAAAREAKLQPACGLTWPLLAGIGRVESDHGRFAGSVLHSDGLSTPPVIGIPLNGNGTALILDTDGGRLDGDTVYDNAVGPMQFIPSTWAGWGVDANGDGVKDPFNIFDAAAAAADYLCAAGRDLTTTRGQVAAILSYNYSFDYVRLVMSLERVYAHGVGITVPILPTSPDPTHGPPVHKPTLPPVDPGTPRGAPPSSSSTPTPTPTTSTPSGSGSTSATRTPTPSPSYTRSAPLPPPSATSTPTPTTSTPSQSPTSTGTDSSTPAGAASSASSDASGATSPPGSP